MLQPSCTGYKQAKEARLPGDVGLPTSPRFAEMLQDRPGLVGAHAFRHHVDDVVPRLRVDRYVGCIYIILSKTSRVNLNPPIIDNSSYIVTTSNGYII